MTRSEEAKLASKRRPIYVASLRCLEDAFRKMEKMVPPPQEVLIGEYPRFRYVEGLIEQAILMKFARLLSLLHALDLLIERALVQEQGIIQRAIDETNQDIIFMSIAVTNGPSSALHDEYLTDFWKEDYSDPNEPVKTRVPRGQVPRRKIRAFLNRAFSQPDPSTADAVGAFIQSTYSGFVHGAAPHLMELFNENHNCFSLSGISGSDRHIDYVLDAQNSYYRSLMSGVVVSKVLGAANVLDDLNIAIAAYRSAIGLERLEMP